MKVEELRRKAKKLVDRFKEIASTLTSDEFSKEIIAKQCALICVDEIELQSKNWGVISVKRYWQEVKQEIEKL